MTALILISDYDSYREICISPCYHGFSFAGIRDIFRASVGRLDQRPTKAELYLSEASDTRLASVAAARGIQMETTSPRFAEDNTADMYEARTRLPFAQLQDIFCRYARLGYSFREGDSPQT